MVLRMTKASRSGAAGKPVEGLSFEKALAELERLVAQMESGDLSLEQGLAAHKRGLELVRTCQARLAASSWSNTASWWVSSFSALAA